MSMSAISELARRAQSHTTISNGLRHLVSDTEPLARSNQANQVLSNTSEQILKPSQFSVVQESTLSTSTTVSTSENRSQQASKLPTSVVPKELSSPSRPDQTNQVRKPKPCKQYRITDIVAN